MTICQSVDVEEQNFSIYLLMGNFCIYTNKQIGCNLNRDQHNKWVSFKNTVCSLSVFNDGSSRELMSLSGTIPVPYRGMLLLLLSSSISPPLCSQITFKTVQILMVQLHYFHDHYFCEILYLTTVYLPWFCCGIKFQHASLVLQTTYCCS